MSSKFLPKGLYHITICIFKALIILTSGSQLRKKPPFKLFSNCLHNRPTLKQRPQGLGKFESKLSAAGVVIKDCRLQYQFEELNANDLKIVETYSLRIEVDEKKSGTRNDERALC